MKRSVFVLSLSVILLVSSGLCLQAQTGKETVEPVTSTFYMTSKTLPLDKDCVFMTWEAFGVVINDAGTGLFHGSTVRCLGSLYLNKGVYTDDIGYGYYLLQNGDKVFFRTVFERKAGAPGKGTTTLIGGTGKCVGIQGSYDLTLYMLKPATEGIGQSYNKLSIKYRLP